MKDLGDLQRGKKKPNLGSEKWDGYWHFPPHAETLIRARQAPGKATTFCGYTDKRPIDPTRVTCKSCLARCRKWPQMANLVLMRFRPRVVPSTDGSRNE